MIQAVADWRADLSWFPFCVYLVLAYMCFAYGKYNALTFIAQWLSSTFLYREY